MTTRTSQYLAIAAALLLLVGIYLFADRRPPSGQGKPPMAGAARDQAAEKPTYNITAYLDRVNAKITARDTLALLDQYRKANDNLHLAALYHALGESVAEAYYTYEAALSQHDTAAMVRAGGLYAATATISSGELQSYLTAQSVESYRQASSWDTSRIDYKIRLGTAYIEQGTQPMQGVSILLDIVKRDSTNAEAQFVLGKFGMVSGQYDKAIVRLEKVLYLQPQNDEAYFLLAEAYRAKGNKDKAIELLDKCGNLVKRDRPDLKKRIDGYIRQIKSEK